MATPSYSDADILSYSHYIKNKNFYVVDRLFFILIIEISDVKIV